MYKLSVLLKDASAAHVTSILPTTSMCNIIKEWQCVSCLHFFDAFVSGMQSSYWSLLIRISEVFFVKAARSIFICLLILAPPVDKSGIGPPPSVIKFLI